MQTAEEAMTPIESTFSLDVASKLDWCVSLFKYFFSNIYIEVTESSVIFLPHKMLLMPNFKTLYIALLTMLEGT
jgi:hypothetical protein